MAVISLETADVPDQYQLQLPAFNTLEGCSRGATGAALRSLEPTVPSAQG